MARYGVVVVGGSAGGIEAVLQMAAVLPPDLNAAVFVVIHLSPSTISTLAELIDKRCALPVGWARDGEMIRAGRPHALQDRLSITMNATIIRNAVLKNNEDIRKSGD